MNPTLFDFFSPIKSNILKNAHLTPFFFLSKSSLFSSLFSQIKMRTRLFFLQMDRMVSLWGTKTCPSIVRRTTSVSGCQTRNLFYCPKNNLMRTRRNQVSSELTNQQTTPRFHPPIGVGCSSSFLQSRSLFSFIQNQRKEKEYCCLKQSQRRRYTTSGRERKSFSLSKIQECEKKKIFISPFL